MNYVTTATSIFNNNQAVGWWTDKATGESLVGNRPIGLIASLIHSELSEAMEGLRKNLQDDHLPHRPMVEVEIADTAIRAYDFLGSELSVDASWLSQDIVDLSGACVDATIEELNPQTPVDYLAAIHSIVSEGYVDSITLSDNVDDMNSLFATDCLSIIIGCERMAERFGYDLTGAIEEKIAYNLNRADHKLENRNKEGGKQF